MSTLQFANTHNLVAYLAKPTESKGFEQIVDFLNAHPIRYALTINPTIYVSHIKQFWTTAKSKAVNGEVQIHALVDGMKVIITESSVRRDLQLVDENDKQLDGLPTHKEKYDVLFYTKKVFANIKRIGKGFFGVNTPRSDEDSLTHFELMKICTTLQKKVLDLEDELKRTKTTQQTKINDLEKSIKDVGEEKVVEVVTTIKILIDTVVDAAQVTTAIVDVPVSAAEIIVTTAPTITVESTKTNVEVAQVSKRKGVMIQEPEETTTTKTIYSQQPQVDDKGKGKAKLVKPEMPNKRKHQISADKELAKKLQAEMQAKIDKEDRLARERERERERSKGARIK
nr:hypothetical protein [Tanacetum cinerariifolium]